MLELETGTNYSEDNAQEAEKEDDNLTAIVADSVESDRKVEGLYLEKEQQKKLKRNRGMKRAIAGGLQDVNSAVETLRKISDGGRTQEDDTFCILYFSSNSCSTCFGQPCTHHQELTTA